MKSKYIIGAIIIISFAGWSLKSFVSTTIKYVSFSEVAHSEGTIQVMGGIDFDTVNYNAENSKLEFEITDLENPDSGLRLKIVYSEVVPGNFEQATSVVAKGVYVNGKFHADQLLVKCPSKYQGEEEKNNS